MTERLKVKNSPWFWLSMLAFCLIFFTLGLVAFFSNERSWWVWADLICFGSGTLLFLVMLFPDSNYLLLTPEGFTVKSLFRTKLTKWLEVKEFTVDKMPGASGSVRAIFYDYIDSYPDLVTTRKLAKAMTGYEAALESGYGMKLEQLCELMNVWRLKYGNGGQANLNN